MKVAQDVYCFKNSLPSSCCKMSVRCKSNSFYALCLFIYRAGIVQLKECSEKRMDMNSIMTAPNSNTVELQWLEHLWVHKDMFET